MQHRPFISVEEMNRVLVDNFNSIVHKDDKVYLLGYICHHMTVAEANELIAGLNGKKYLIRGNHDKQYDPTLFEEVADFMTISANGVYFALMHYPMLAWPKSHHGSVQLHGHVHGRMEDNELNREQGILRYDVGVDANGFCPVSVRQIIEFFGL